MSNIRKKIINKWDTGITTSIRDNNPDTSSGAQMIKGFDIYKDPKKLIPMQSWTSFTSDAEKAYNIRALGGVSDTVYGVGYGLSNWYGSGWDYRLRVDIEPAYHLATGIPLHLDMSLLPSDFWNNINSDGGDIRVTTEDGVTAKGIHIENLDLDTNTGDMWIPGDVVELGTQSFSTVSTQTGTGTAYTLNNAVDNNYAFDIPVTLTGNTINFLTINLLRLGTPSSLRVYLYSDNAGTPNALVADLGTINYQVVPTVTAQNVSLSFADQTLTGNYHIILSSATADGSNYYEITYQSTGTITLKEATNSGLTAWSNVDTTATPNYTLSYFTTTKPDKYFYIYYGNSSATLIPAGTPTTSYTYGSRIPFTDTDMRWAYTFGDDTTGNRYYNADNTTGDTEAFTTDPALFTSGYFGRAIRTLGTSISTDQDDEVALSANDIGFSFMIKCTAWENATLYADSLGYWSIKLNSSGKIVVEIDGSIATTICTSALAVSLNEWHVIDVSFDTDTTIYIDGVKETFDINDGDADVVVTNSKVQLNSGNNCTLAQVWGFNNNLTDNQVSTKFNNFIRTGFFTVGSHTAKSSVNLQYSGVQLYQKSISSGDWEEYIQSGSPVKSLSYYPMNGFVDSSGTYFTTTATENDYDAFLYLAAVDNTAVIDPDFLFLGFGSSSSKIAIQKETAINGTTYFNDTGTVLNSLSSISAFTNLAAIQSISAWKTYLGIGANSRSEGFLQIWDLAASNATDKIKVGTGNLRIVGNASDILFCVVDNFIDDAVRSSNKPTMEIKQYVGDGKVDTTHVIEVPAIIDDSTYIDEWERAVSNFKLSRNFVTLFYARLPNNEAGTTFDQGFWAVGKNSDGQLSLSLMIPTDDLGMPENVHGFAQQVFFVQKDGGIVRLADSTYDDTSLFKTLKMNEGNTEIEKKLIGVEIVTEPLESGQTISVYYKKNGDTERTKIFDMTGENEISYETTYDINEANLPHYKEIEFDIESTGGKSAPLEFNYKFEYLSEIV